HAAALARHYLSLLESSAASPSSPAAALRLLDSRQRHRLFGHSRSACASSPQARQPFHILFAAQAARRPDAVAVVEEEEQLTYAELDRRSNRLARYLRGIGVGPEKIVGLYLPRSARMVEAMLGTLKAGGAYLPLDTASPAERVRLMVEDAGALVTLSETGEEEKLEDLGCAVIGLERERERVAVESDEAVEDVVCEGNLAYVIYTSGSTGRPKGVMVE